MPFSKENTALNHSIVIYSGKTIPVASSELVSTSTAYNCRLKIYFQFTYICVISIHVLSHNTVIYILSFRTVLALI